MRIFLLAAALALGLIWAPSSWGQAVAETEEDDGPMAWASLTVEADHAATMQVITSKASGDIAIALDQISGHPPRTSAYGLGWTQLTIELPAPMRQGLLLRQEIEIGPLLEALHRQGQPTLPIQIRHPRVAYTHVSGAQVFALQGLMSATLPTAPPQPPLVLELGWRQFDVARTVILLLLAFAWPVLAGFLVWRRSIARDQGPQAWFGRAHMLQNLLIAGWVVWIVAVEATLVGDLTTFALGPGGRSWMMTAPLWMLGFLPAALLLMAMARRIVRRLRGFDPQPRGGVATLLRLLVPLLLLVAAASAFFARDPRTGVFALLGAIAAGVLLPGARGPLGVAPQALSSGPLRDRLFDLARRAGVRLRELYVAPMRRQRMANAFAVNGGVVMVTDELLDRMSRREVDAVLAHEISHLEHHHPRMMVASAGLAWALMSVISMPVGFAYVVPMGIAASWLAYLFVARRCEFAADAGAAALTADPEAMISGLGQLARLNDTPLCWSRARGWLITHPTTEARAKAIGRRAGIAEDRVAELLGKGLAEHDRYAQSERPGEGERVFSTAWKTRTLGRLSLTLLASAVIAPALAIALLRAFGVATPHALAILGGALLAFLAVLAAQDQIAARPVSRLEPALRQRIAESSGTEARFVAMSPGDRPRVYEGFLDWDLGVLTLTPERLHYRGEQITLDLPRDAVSQIEVGAVAPGWIPAPRVIVRWQGPEGETAWTLRAADARRVSAIGPATLGLAARLRSWRGPAPPTPMTGPPAIGPVTAITLAQATAPRDLPVLLVLLGTFSAAASYLLGLDFWLGVDVLAAALIGLMVMRWPAMTSREPARVKTGAHQPERRAA